MTRRLPAVLQVFAAALMLVMAVAVDRSPTVFTDSDDYYELGRRIVADLHGVFLTKPPPELSPEETAQRAEDLHMGHSQMASRSAAYALLLYPLDVLGTLWLVTLVQALLVAALVRALWRTLVPDAPAGHYLLGMAALAVASTLPFFAGFAMPDIFAPIVVLTMALLVLKGRGGWLLALLALAVAVHGSHLLLALVMLPVAALALRYLKASYRPLVLVGVAIIAAWGFGTAYVQIDLMQTGEQLRRQPFLTARLLADGPGRDYLRHACATGRPFVLCSFKHEPLDDSEDILWSDLPATGVFLRSDFATRIALEDEEMRFALGTIAHDPAGVVAAAFRNWGRQLAAYHVEEPVRDPVYYLTDDYWGETYLPQMIRRVAECGPAGNRCALRMTPALSRVLHGGVIAVALLAIGWLSWRRAGPIDDQRRRMLVAVALLIIGVIFNAAVCGILSGPFARYEARLMWLIPLAAMLMLSAERVRLTRSAAP